MLKKKTAILFLSLAYAILLGHNIIPHHHHDYDHHANEHPATANHHDDHEHDSDADSEGLSHLFSHFVHSEDGFTFTTAHNITNTFSKQQLSLVAVLPDNFALDDFLIPPLLDRPPAEHLVYISPHSHPSGLRAPPATFI